MPPEFYLPAIGALTATIGVLWARLVMVTDRHFDVAMQATEAINASTESLEEQSRALHAIAEALAELAHEVRATATAIRAPQGGAPARYADSRPPGPASGRGGAL